MARGDRYSEEDDRRLTRMWKEGVGLKRIMLELDRGKGSIHSAVKRLKLKPRRRNKVTKKKLSAYIDADVYDSASMKAAATGKSLSLYITNLINRDLV